MNFNRFLINFKSCFTEMYLVTKNSMSGVQVLKLSKVAGLQSPTLLKMSYFTGSFNLSE